MSIAAFPWYVLLEHDRAAWAHGAASQLEALGAPGALHREVRPPGLYAFRRRRRDAARGQQRERSRAASHRQEPAPGRGQRLGHEVPQLPGPDYDDAVAGRDTHLLLDFECGGGGLGEDRHLVGNSVRHHVQVADGQHQVRREGPVARDDAEDAPPLAVGAAAREAGRARAARGVDLADDTAADPLGRAVRLPHDANELVPWNARVRVVATDQLEVGVAHAGQAHAHERLARGRSWLGNVVAQAKSLALEPQGAQGLPPEPGEGGPLPAGEKRRPDRGQGGQGARRQEPHRPRPFELFPRLISSDVSYYAV